ncbi:MAG: hypothetical protein IOC80_10705 [Rhodobacter sp.]|nr:hypothetical protein [Rhodobacter sp.]MCA3513729.1 hypothetical protein [Rhodobacter sp.]MCA3519718.1 hypothetical protein [Rhodobacter sp.]MCA3522851.1 hypothetical protein [Rhodobacter sp.]MCA3527158.1 hypothetical protein [Rhodobacter sp.]
MKRPGLPLFLQRRPYRRRRKIDAARLLPVFGAFLLLLPMLWAPAGDEGRGTVGDGLYLFVVWAGLIAVARLLAPSLTADGQPDPDEGKG